jgi:mannose-6-phosphate isomerase-like protein (cupin superfamily)
MNESFRHVQIRRIDDPRYIMSPVELKDFIDFDVKRVYFISQPVKDSGAHCHLREKEFFILVSGTATLKFDRGQGIEEIRLTAPQDAVYIANYVWHQFVNFSPDAILLALSSTNYNPDRSDYIEDYEAYLKVRDAGLARTCKNE